MHSKGPALVSWQGRTLILESDEDFLTPERSPSSDAAILGAGYTPFAGPGCSSMHSELAGRASGPRERCPTGLASGHRSRNRQPGGGRRQSRSVVEKQVRRVIKRKEPEM
jgi:hypothetical protein